MKICGITGFPPLFVSKIQGHLDAGNEMVVISDKDCDSSWIRKKLAAGQVAIDKCFLELEKNTAKLFEESRVFCMQYYDNESKLKDSDPPISGKAIETRRRNIADLENRKPALIKRNEEIRLRLAAIEEQLVDEVVKTSKTKEQVFSLIDRRIHAYLSGASKVAKRIPVFQAETKVCRKWEEEYFAAHEENNQLREKILSIQREESI